MFYTYYLQSKKDGSFYVGFTEDLKKRIIQHNNKKSRYTKSKIPWKLIFYEAYLNKYDALRRETYLKSTKGRTTLRNMLKEYLAERR